MITRVTAVCSNCSKGFDKTLKEVNQVIRKSGAWTCLECARAKRRIDLLGQRFGRLVVTSFSHVRAGNARSSTVYWNAQCDCGGATVTTTYCLRNGYTNSCGCLKTEALKARSTHGKTGTREYRIWQAMLNRCRNKNMTGWANYGGRGIKVCERWSDFNAFLADMGPCPAGHSIDRIDNDANYEPSNCRWASRTDQARNKRSNRRLSLDGETKCLKEWANDLGIDQASLRERLKRWTTKEALTTPKGAHQ